MRVVKPLCLAVTLALALGCQAYGAILCRHCGAEVFHEEQYLHDTVPEDAETKPLPVLGPDAVQHLVQNPILGESQSLVTFADADAHTIAPHAVERRHTYFPPYYWTPLHCGRCNNHIGWAYLTKKEPDEGKDMSKSANAEASQGDAPQNETPQDEAPPSPTPQQASSVAVQNAQESAQVVLSEDYIRKKLQVLRGTCFSLHRGWWTYEWCHEKHVRQYHRNARGEIEFDWSLGLFDTQDTVARATVPQSPNYRYSHFYIGGQICHETNKNRRTEVQFFCCPKQLKNAKTPPVASLEDLMEPSLCRYKAIVCVPSLCTSSSVPDGAKASSAAPRKQQRQAPAATKDTASKPAPSDNYERVFVAALWSNVVSSEDEEIQWMNSLPSASGFQHPG